MDFDARVERSRLVVLFVVSLFDICSCYVAISVLNITRGCIVRLVNVFFHCLLLLVSVTRGF